MKISRPLPVPDNETKQYWQGAKEGKLLIQKCKECKNVRFYPRIICPNCMSDQYEWIESKGVGNVYSYTIVYKAPKAFLNMAPYIVAIIELDEKVRMMSQILHVDLEEIFIGMRVKVSFEKINEEITLPQFLAIN